MEKQTKYTFDINGNYKAQFETYVNTLITSIRESGSSAISNRDVRAKEIKSLSDAYVEAVGERPDEFQLERLTDLFLYEELTDSNPDKMTLDEYPIMSEMQLLRRQFGKGVKKGKLAKGEVPLKKLKYIGADHKNHHIPTPRPLSTYEMILRDKTKSFNKERQRKYNEFIKQGKVSIWKINCE
ncbi:hypothetical protein [Bacillus cereus]